MSRYVATTGTMGSISYFTGMSYVITGNIVTNGNNTFNPSRWTETTLQQRIKDAQEYIAHLKDSRDRLKAIIG